MTVSVAQMRADYPEFAATARFPTSALTYWLNLAYLMLNPARWGDLLDVGAELFAAHNLALEIRAQDEARGGGVPGNNVGPVSSRGVDKASVSYDTAAAIYEHAGQWNLTTYGTRFWNLVQMMGAGPVQIGGCIDWDAGPAFLRSQNAWTGPDTSPGWFS